MSEETWRAALCDFQKSTREATRTRNDKGSAIFKCAGLAATDYSFTAPCCSSSRVALHWHSLRRKNDAWQNSLLFGVDDETIDESGGDLRVLKQKIIGLRCGAVPSIRALRR
jgi:hypothetical protein